MKRRRELTNIDRSSTGLIRMIIALRLAEAATLGPSSPLMKRTPHQASVICVPVFNPRLRYRTFCSLSAVVTIYVRICSSSRLLAGCQLALARTEEKNFKTRLGQENARQTELAQSLEHAYTKILAAGLDPGVSEAP